MCGELRILFASLVCHSRGPFESLFPGHWIPYTLVINHWRFRVRILSQLIQGGKTAGDDDLLHTAFLSRSPQHVQCSLAGRDKQIFVATEREGVGRCTMDDGGDILDCVGVSIGCDNVGDSHELEIIGLWKRRRFRLRSDGSADVISLQNSSITIPEVLIPFREGI